MIYYKKIRKDGQQKMKKVISVLFVCLFILSGCSNSSEEQEYSSDYEQDIENSDCEYDFLLGNEDTEEIVDEISVDNSEISLKYTGFEIKDDIDDNEQPIKRIVIYLDFTNKMNSPMSSSNSINSIAYQGGIELQGWGGADYLNDMTEIKDGATLNVGFMFDLLNTDEPVEINLSNGIWYEGSETFSQTQKINIS